MDYELCVAICKCCKACGCHFGTRDNKEAQRKFLSLLNGRQGGSPSSKFGLDWPQIDRFTKTQDQGVLIVKILLRVTASPGNNWGTAGGAGEDSSANQVILVTQSRIRRGLTTKSC